MMLTQNVPDQLKLPLSIARELPTILHSESASGGRKRIISKISENHGIMTADIDEEFIAYPIESAIELDEKEDGTWRPIRKRKKK